MHTSGNPRYNNVGGMGGLNVVSREHPKLFRPIILEGTLLKNEGHSKEASFEFRLPTRSHLRLRREILLYTCMT